MGRSGLLSDDVVKVAEAGSEQEAAMICGLLESNGIRATYDNGGVFQPAQVAFPFGGAAGGLGGAALASLRPVIQAKLVNLGTVDYVEALELQREVAAKVAAGDEPDTVLLLEHPPTITLGRRTEADEVHVPDGADVAIVEVDRGGKSTYHAPGQLVCYPILDLARHGQDVKKYCRDLEEALIRTTAVFDVESTRIDGLTGVWLERPPRKIASIGIHLSKWISTHGYALNVDLDPAPFTEWITACGLENAAFTSLARELDRPVTVDDVRPAAAQALADVFGLVFADTALAAA